MFRWRRLESIPPSLGAGNEEDRPASSLVLLRVLILFYSCVQFLKQKGQIWSYVKIMTIEHQKKLRLTVECLLRANG